MARVGDMFWEYNELLNDIYPRRIHSDKHLDYYRKGYGVRAFDTLSDAFKVHPKAYIFTEHNYEE